MPAKFRCGRLVATPAAIDAAEKAGQDFLPFLSRHFRGDWGDVCAEDAKMNDDALKPGSEERLLSVYTLNSGEKIWIITEWDRSATTILLPSDY